MANAYQAIAALVAAGARSATDPGAVAVLRRVTSQIQAYQAVHFLLRAGAGSQRLDAGHYLGLLCKRLAAAHLAGRTTSLALEAEQVMLCANACSLLGLLVNELVLNAAKHAFPDGRQGTIVVRLAASGPSWRCSVADDGVGVVRDNEMGESGGAGLDLAHRLAAALGGQLRRDSACVGGTIMIFDCPRDAAAAAII